MADNKSRRPDPKRQQEMAAKALAEWQPKTELGRKVKNPVGTSWFASPAEQPACGDIATQRAFIRAYGITSGDLPRMSHVRGANTGFMDGHVAWFQKKEFKRYVHYYYTDCRIYWK